MCRYELFKHKRVETGRRGEGGGTHLSKTQVADSDLDMLSCKNQTYYMYYYDKSQVIIDDRK